MVHQDGFVVDELTIKVGESLPGVPVEVTLHSCAERWVWKCVHVEGDGGAADRRPL